MKLRCLLPLVLALSLCGCGSSARLLSENDSKPSSEDAEITNPSAILTDLFSPTEIPLPENCGVHGKVTPFYDPESGIITAFARSSEEVETDTDSWETVWHGWLVELSANGELLDIRELPMPENTAGEVFAGTVTEDFLICCCPTALEKNVYRIDLATGETIAAEDSVTAVSDFSFTQFAVDGEGMAYCTDEQTVHVLNPDLTLAFSLDFPTRIYTMARGSDGAVWVVFNAGMEAVAAKIDKETQKLGDYHPFTRGSDTLTQTTHDLLPAPTTDGTHNFYYFDSTAVWGVTVKEDGSLEEERQMDLFNSGVPKLDMQSYGKDSDTMAAAMLSDDLLLTVQRERYNCGTPTLHRRSADVNLEEVQSILVAHAYALAPSSVDYMMAFGRENPGIRIVAQDYSIYATQEDPLGGENKLCFDLLNGIIEPDIVITRASDRTVADNSVMRQLTKNNLCVDLLPFLQTDDEINTDTIFGCIPRLFDDGKGGMWGIATDFSLYTLLAGREVLGEDADKNFWTVEEMFDFYDSLPPDAEAWYNFTRAIPKWQLFGQGYSLFIGADGSSFTDGTFTRYLEFLQNAPATPQERRQTSPYVNLNEEERRAALTLGKIGTDFMYISDAVWVDTFRMLIDKDLCPIGYATNTDSGIRITADHAYAITTYAENPDVCFDLLKTFFVPGEHSMNTDGLGEWNIYALKAQVEDRMRQYTSMWSDTEMLTDEELKAVFDVIDGAGFPILELTPTAIDEIVEEEVSAYLAGVGTAENCAEKIQSRVDIWLAEHN